MAADWRALFRRSILRTGAALVVGGACVLPALGVDNPKLRTWKDSSGSFEIKAEFVGESNGMVTLRQEGGEEVEIELEKLSSLDQNFIKNQKKSGSPFKKKTPFKSKSAPSRTEEPEDAPSSEPSDVSNSGSVIGVDWSSAKLVQAADQNNWEAIKIEPAPAGKARKSVQIPKKRDFFEGLTGFAAGPQTTVVGYKLEARGGTDGAATTRIVTIDAGGKPQSVVVDGNYALLDVSPVNGAVLVKKDVWGFGNQSELEVWRIDGKSVDRQAVITPFPGEDGPSKDISWAAFIDENHIAALGGWGKFGTFDMSSGSAEFVTTFTNQTSVALSPDRKYLAVASGKDIQILDALQGDGLAVIKTETQAMPRMAFSNDGQRLVLQNSDRLTAWELKDGTVYRDVVLSGLSFQPSIAPIWTSPTHVLAGGSALIDLDAYVRLWQYNGAESVVGTGDQALFCISSHSEPGAVVALKLPHEGAVKTLKQAMTDPNFFVVTPGASVRVDVSGITDGAQQQKAKEALTSRLTAAGMKVADNAPITLRALVENGGSEEVTYRNFGAGFGETKVNVTKFLSRVQYQVNGTTVWEAVVNATPYFLNRSEDESIEQAVRKANVPNFGFFQSVAIPTYVMKPLQPNQQTLGFSSVTPNGLR